MKILITGFVGFIGYFLSKNCPKNNFRVVGIDNSIITMILAKKVGLIY